MNGSVRIKHFLPRWTMNCRPVNLPRSDLVNDHSLPVLVLALVRSFT